MPITRRYFSLAIAAAAGLPAALARADDYPSHPIRMIVPYAPGGGADVIGRIVAKALGETIGQAVIVENRGGGGAIIGTEVVQKATPDGYTLLVGQSGPISINPAVYRSLPYDPVKDFAPITMTTAYPYILVINAALPAKDLAEFVALAKAKPGEFNFGTTGVGAANHLVSELFCARAGLKMTHIPYRGTALAVSDLLAGRVTMVFADAVTALPHIKAGTLRALAVSSKDRAAIAPDVPTIAESGYPEFDAIGWHGILAPAKTPPAIVKRLNEEIVKALNDPATKALLEAQAMQIVGNTPDEFAAFIKQDIALWQQVATQANVEVK